MEHIYFTQAGMYQLATINTHLRRTVGRSYHLSRRTELELMLREAFASNDPHLQERCKRLYQCLWVEEREKLNRLLQADVAVGG